MSSCAPLVRSAHAGDVAGIARIAAANGQPPRDSGRDPRRLTGRDRSADYLYWAEPAAAGGSGLVIEQDDEVIAAGAIRDGALPHLVVSGTADPAAALFAALSLSGTASARLCLPGPHPALGASLHAGFMIEDLDHYMSTTEGLVPTSDVPSPALA